MKAKLRERIKIGRRTVGGVYETSSGRRAFLAFRRVADVQHATERDIAAAIRAGSATWAIESEIVSKMRMQGVPVIGVVVRDTGERFIASTEKWFDMNVARNISVRGRGGSFRALPFSAFHRFVGKIPKLRA